MVQGEGEIQLDVYLMLMLPLKLQHLILLYLPFHSLLSISYQIPPVGNKNNKPTGVFFGGGKRVVLKHTAPDEKQPGASCYARSLDVKQQPLDQFALWLS